MAIGIDLGFVALEGAQLTSTSEKLWREVIKYTKPAIIGTLSGSAVMNAFALSAQTSGWMTGAAIVLGLAIPALIYALTRIGGAMGRPRNSAVLPREVPCEIAIGGRLYVAPGSWQLVRGMGLHDE
jgi:hypothetical protein